MADIFISYAHKDRERAHQLAEALRARGWTVSVERDLRLNAGFDNAVDQELDAAQCVIVLWSEASVTSEWVGREAARAQEHGKLLPVLLEPVAAPLAFKLLQAADLSGWKGDRADPALESMVEHIAGVLSPHQPEAAPAPAAPAAAPARLVKRVWDMLRPLSRDSAASAPASPAPQPPLPSAVPQEPEPVLLGVSAPRRVERGSVFSARFVAYIEALEERVRQQLKELGGDEAQSALGITPERAARWRTGTPVTVRLEAGPHISVRPAEAQFEWSGRHNLVSFSLTVAPDAPAARAQLRFEAFIEGLSVAFIPLDIAIAQAADPAQATASARPPTTAFASYSSLDAPNVTLCLSALAHWDAGLKVFVDCLDLTPNEPWRQELERVIPDQDAFFLFWSANAMKSKWVDWEWRLASARKGIEAIRPFPLDDPAVAPPPPELQHLHFRDRYMMARQALARVAESRK